MKCLRVLCFVALLFLLDNFFDYYQPFLLGLGNVDNAHRNANLYQKKIVFGLIHIG